MMRLKKREINAAMTLLTTRSWYKRIAALLIVMTTVLTYWLILYQPVKGQEQSGQILQGRIVGIADGDTVTLLTPDNDSIIIRFAYVDAPEKNQAYGQIAKQHLSQLIYQKMVEVIVKEKDRYGRTIGQVMLDGQDLNLAQIQAGYAWHYTQYARSQVSTEYQAYEQAQAEAKNARRGVWQMSNPIPPWRFRRTH